MSCTSFSNEAFGRKTGISAHLLDRDTVFLQSDAAATIYFAVGFVHTIRGQRLFLWKACRHQRRLDKVRTSETMTFARRS